MAYSICYWQMGAVKRIDRRKVGELGEEIGVAEEPSGVNGGEAAKVGGTCGENGSRSPDKESRCIPRGRQEGKRKTATEMGGLREKRRQEGRGRRKLEGKSARQKRMEENSSEGD